MAASEPNPTKVKILPNSQVRTTSSPEQNTEPASATKTSSPDPVTENPQHAAQTQTHTHTSPRNAAPTQQTTPTPPQQPSPSRDSLSPYPESVEYVEDEEIGGISRLAKAVKDFGAAQHALKPGWQTQMEETMGHVLAQQLEAGLHGNGNQQQAPPPQEKMDFVEKIGLQLAANDNTPLAIGNVVNTLLGFADKHLTTQQIQTGYDKMVAQEHAQQQAQQHHDAPAPAPAEHDPHPGPAPENGATQPQQPESEAQEQFDIMDIDVNDPEQCYQLCRELGEPVTDPVSAQHLVYAMQREELKARGEDPDTLAQNSSQTQPDNATNSRTPGAATNNTAPPHSDNATTRTDQNTAPAPRGGSDETTTLKEQNKQMQEYLEFLEEELQTKEEEIDYYKNKKLGINPKPRTVPTEQEEPHDGETET